MNLKIRFLFVVTLLSALVPFNSYANESCSLFRLYRSMPLPDAPHTRVPQDLSDKQVSELLTKIARVPFHHEFPDAYRHWIQTHKNSMNLEERYAWLSCVLHFISMDTNHNGTPDWTALIDGQPSQVLYPLDKDIDGDGIENVFDPQPFKKGSNSDSVLGPRTLRISAERPPKEIPSHLLAALPEARPYQKLLFEKFGILAIDHTDRHSPRVLKNLLLLLETVIPVKVTKKLKSLRYIYAFAGHDSRINIAAYHHQAQAISIGGLNSYPPDEGDAGDEIRILATLAHEIGHSFLFDLMTVSDLTVIAKRYGEWDEPLTESGPSSLFSSAFFKPHGPLLKKETLNRSFTSEYSFTNVHEWFADAFAAALLYKLANLGKLAKDWKEKVSSASTADGQYWTNYGSLAPDFREWILTKVSQVAR